MAKRAIALFVATLVGLTVPDWAFAAIGTGQQAEPAPNFPSYLQCVPYARYVSGINIYGDAHTWWDQAAGRYARGHEPRVGAVLAFRPNGNMRLGHVAAVSRVVDSRTILLRHANWSLIDGRRGQIEDNVRAIDVSPDNDWSEVRVWYAPIQGLGTTHWPTSGFIYNRSSAQGGQRESLARATDRVMRGEGQRQAEPASRNFDDDPIGAIIAQKARRLTRR